jgi:hypothetical protein
MQNKQVIIYFILFLFFTSAAEGQKLINSPYARFNIGSLDPTGSFRSLSMGGTGIGMRENNTIYFNNPASYSSIDTTSFVFDFGLDYSVIGLSNGTSSYSSDDMNFNHLIMGFPISKGWGVAIGIVPVSNGYYNLSQITKNGDPGYDPIAGSIASLHKGTGGFTKFFLGTGVNIVKGLSAGANLNILFGEVERLNEYAFVDQASSFSQLYIENLRISGLNFDYGLQYSVNLKKEYFLTGGFSLTAEKKYRSSLEQLKERFANYSYDPYSPDTLSYINGTSKDSTRLPGTIRFGLSFGKKDKFVAGVDYVLSNWSDARIHGSDALMANTKSLSMGIEYIPDKYSNLSFLKRIEYRLGAHFSDNYIILNGVQLKEYGFSCGLGVPMRNPFNRTNIYFDYTRRSGDLAKGLHNENIYSIGLSVNLYEQWFYKQRYQ